MGRLLLAVVLAYCLFGCNVYHKDRPLKISIAKNGQALHAIVVGHGATERTHEAAKELAKYLSIITGVDFVISEGDGTKGIAVGNWEDFPKLRLQKLFDSKDPTRRDEYLLRTHTKGIYLVGATDLAAQHAVWDFLYRTGYRQFFPTDTWEYVPEVPNLSIMLDVFEKPDFYNRNGPRPASQTDSKQWLRWHDRNRITSSFTLNTGHSYNGIIERNKKAFEDNPEFLALSEGKRGGGRGDKFCISNGKLRQLVVEDAKRRVEDDPDGMSISMDPSDGSSWCECELCKDMGSVSDRVIILANEVAEAINNMSYGEKYVNHRWIFNQ